MNGKEAGKVPQMGNQVSGRVEKGYSEVRGAAGESIGCVREKITYLIRTKVHHIVRS